MENYELPILISGADLDDTWQKIVLALKDIKGYSTENMLVHVAKPTRQVPKQLQQHEAEIVSWSRELQSTKPERLPFTHGQRIYEWFSGGKVKSKFDQIRDYVVPMLLRNNRTKRAIVMVRNTSLDSDLTDDPIPALISIQFKLQDNKLHATAYYRAQEMYFFWLVNMFELISMQETICQQLKSRSSEINVEPGAISTFAFVGYINSADLEKLDAAESTTLAIERFGISRLKDKELGELLESALVHGDANKVKELRNILVHDKQTLDRIRDIDYQGLERWQNFLQNNHGRILTEFKEMPDILRKVLVDLVSLDMQLEREEGLPSLKKRIKSADSSLQELVNILARKEG